MSTKVPGSDRLMFQLNALKGVGKVFPMPSAQVIAKRASQIAPRDTGYMAEHIHPEKAEETGAASVVSEAPYSVHVEYGTYKMQAQPFMRPAIDEGQSEILKAAARAIEVEIKQRLK